MIKNARGAAVFATAVVVLALLCVPLFDDASADVAYTEELEGGTVSVDCTVVLQGNTELLNDLVISSGATVTLDLNGYALKGTGSGSVITVNGTLTVVSSSGTGTITGGKNGFGGGIRNNGTLTISDCILTGNEATASGGAVYNTGVMVMYDCQLLDNEADVGGGAIYSTSSGGSEGLATIENCVMTGNYAYHGGAIYNAGDMEITDCDLSYNDCGYYGGAVYGIDGSTVMYDCTVIGNTSAYHGGGLDTSSGCTFTMYRCTVSENYAPHGGGYYNYGGNVYIYDCIITDNSASMYGGGVANTTSTYMYGCVVTGNTAQYGGGVYNSRSIEIQDCVISDNDATYGGGVRNTGSVTMDGCTLTGNTATSGGAIRNTSTLSMTDCIVHSNEATTCAGIRNDSGAKLTISGYMLVYANDSGDGASGIYMYDGQITLGSALEDGSAVVVTYAESDSDDAIQVTATESDTSYYEASYACFFYCSADGTTSLVSEASDDGCVQFAADGAEYQIVQIVAENIDLDDGQSPVVLAEAGSTISVAIYLQDGYGSVSVEGDGYTVEESADGLYVLSGTVSASAVVKAVAGGPYVYAVYYYSDADSDAWYSYTEDSESDACTVKVTSSEPDSDGYVLLGWTSTAGSTSVEYEAGDSITLSADTGVSVELYAVWGVSYTIVFDANGGSFDEGETSTVTVYSVTGAATYAIAVDAPSNSGYVLLGWSTSSDSDEPEYTSGDAVSVESSESELTLYAVWGYSYSVTYDSNGGQFGIGDTYTAKYSSQDASVTVEVTDYEPGMDDAAFIGWSTSADASEADYVAGDIITLTSDAGSVTLYAVWESSASEDSTDSGDDSGSDLEDTSSDDAGSDTDDDASDSTEEESESGSDEEEDGDSTLLIVAIVVVIIVIVAVAAVFFYKKK